MSENPAVCGLARADFATPATLMNALPRLVLGTPFTYVDLSGDLPVGVADVLPPALGSDPVVQPFIDLMNRATSHIQGSTTGGSPPFGGWIDLFRVPGECSQELVDAGANFSLGALQVPLPSALPTEPSSVPPTFSNETIDGFPFRAIVCPDGEWRGAKCDVYAYAGIGDLLVIMHVYDVNEHVTTDDMRDYVRAILEVQAEASAS
jgi:hypothetical protein